MADNVSITPGSGEDIAADDIGGIKHQRVKVQHGADGSATDVSSASPLPVGDAGGSLTVDDGGSSLTVDAPLGTPVGVRLSDGGSAIGSTAQRLHVDDGGSSLSVDDGGGSLTVDVGAALPAGTNNIGQVDPRGNVAHDAVDSGNPIKVGGRARTALPAAVAQDDRTDAIHDKHGRLLVAGAPVDQHVDGKANYTNTTTADVIAAPGASVAIVVTTILVVNGHPTVGTKVEIRDGTTVKLQPYCAALGGGFNLHDEDGLFIATANTAVTARCATTGADVDVFIAGYKIPA